MNKMIGAILLLLSLNTFAMSEDKLAECMTDQKEHTQMLLSIVADEASAGRVSEDDYNQYINNILSSKVKTCREAGAAAAEKIAQIFKAHPTVSGN